MTYVISSVVPRFVLSMQMNTKIMGLKLHVYGISTLYPKNIVLSVEVTDSMKIDPGRPTCNELEAEARTFGCQ